MLRDGGETSVRMVETGVATAIIARGTLIRCVPLPPPWHPRTPASPCFLDAFWMHHSPTRWAHLSPFLPLLFPPIRRAVATGEKEARRRSSRRLGPLPSLLPPPLEPLKTPLVFFALFEKRLHSACLHLTDTSPRLSNGLVRRRPPPADCCRPPPPSGRDMTERNILEPLIAQGVLDVALERPYMIIDLIQQGVISNLVAGGAPLFF
eukprot:1193653-Prorocentrum_minimum.AAC.8